MNAVKKVAALTLSLMVHGLTALLILLGGWIILWNPDFLLAWLGGGLIIAIGVLLFPRPRRLRADAEVVDRSSAPELYGVAERVARAVGTPPPVMVAVEDLSIGAQYVRVGWRRRPALVIGLPLWLVLPARQRVVLLAKAYTDETGDDILISGALWTLAQWRESLMSGGTLAKRGETHIYMATILGAAAPRGSYDAAGTLGQILGRVMGWPALLVERLLLALTRTPSSRSRSTPTRLQAVTTDAEVTHLTEMMESRRFLAPLQAAALRGATVQEIRRAAPVLEEDPRPDRRELLPQPASDAIDGELSRHYSRAIRAFGLIW
ncbi:M48 family metallopeptidase [Sphaerisporangium aureirubrum]|uniref:M48 family metallopeptidase n=1 Tax=Sphaerisporangium aureirubrum TaxID=1544736 RepID=A0ABW1NG75_9ACTN